MDSADSVLKEDNKPTVLTFMDLPVEVRLNIYRLCVPNRFVFDVRMRPTFAGPPRGFSRAAAPFNFEYGHYYSINEMADDDEDQWETDDDEDQWETDDDESSGSMHFNYLEESELEACPASAALDLVFGREHGASSEKEVDEDDHNIKSYVDIYTDSDTDGDTESDTDSDRESDWGPPIDEWADPAEPRPEWQPTVQGLLVASKKIREEVLDILYRENAFRVMLGRSDSKRALVARFSEAKIKRMRHILLVFQLGYQYPGFPETRQSYRDCFPMPRPVWDGILSNLATLRLVTGQPNRPEERSDWPDHTGGCHQSMIDTIRSWTRRLSPTLIYLGEALSPIATLLADVDRKTVTSDLMNRLLGRHWTEVQTTTGDLLGRC